MTQLRTCPTCVRHVLIHEQACPFCKRELEPVPERVPLRVAANLSRAQRLTLAAAIAGQAVSACAEVTETSAMPVYGAPVAGNVAPVAGSGNAGRGTAAGTPGGGGTAGVFIAPPYGLPPPPPDAGIGGGPVYGAPIAGQPSPKPRPDAGAPDAAADDDAGPAPTKDGGTMFQPLYGAPVPVYGAPIPKK